MRKKVAAILLLVFLGAFFGAYGLSNTFISIASSGRIVTIGVEVYEDADLTLALLEIDWGELEPGDIGSKSFWAYNNGSVPITLSFNTSSWLPTNAEAYLDLTWNYAAGAVIGPSESLKLTFSLYVHPDISGIVDFSFIITIVGTKGR